MRQFLAVAAGHGGRVAVLLWVKGREIYLRKVMLLGGFILFSLPDVLVDAVHFVELVAIGALPVPFFHLRVVALVTDLYSPVSLD